MRRMALAPRARRRQPAGAGPVSWSPTALRCAGGMLGVLVADTWPIGSTQGSGPDAPIAVAMVDLARSLTAPTARDPLGEVAARHDGIAGSAWLLPLSLADHEPSELTADPVGQATRNLVRPDKVDACVAYVKLAAQLAANHPVPAAIAHVAGLTVPTDQPLETGNPAPDGLTLGLWALAQQAQFGELLGKLAATSSRPVIAAAAGLLGLRDGLEAIPTTWYRHLDLTDACLALAPALKRTHPPLTTGTAAG
jgi:hypothetical protein